MGLERAVRSPPPSTPRATRAAKPGGGLKIAGSGRIYVWNGGSLWIGRGQFHKHHAIQVTLAPEGPVLRIRRT
jgi:hypothetical protein